MMLAEILGSRNRVRVLRTLLREDGVSGRKVASTAQLSPSACQAALKDLVGIGLVFETREPGRCCYELNRSHNLMPALQHLYGEEVRFWDRLAELVRRQARSLEPPSQLLGLGLSAPNRMTLALRPAPAAEHLQNSPLANDLWFCFGLHLAAVVGDAAELADCDRTLPVRAAGAEQTAQRARGRERALDFFGIRKPRGEP